MQQGIVWVVVVVLVVAIAAGAMVALRESEWRDAIERASRGVFGVLPTPYWQESPPVPTPSGGQPTPTAALPTPTPGSGQPPSTPTPGGIIKPTPPWPPTIPNKQ